MPEPTGGTGELLAELRRGPKALLAAFAAIAPMVAPAAAPAQQAAQRLRLAEELRIGAVDGPAALSAVHSLALSAEGHLLFVGQSRDAAVKVFDARSGALVRVLGREGEGPGELRSAGPLTVRGDTLFVADRVQQRMARFTTAGEHVGTDRIASAPLPGSRRPALPLVAAPGGLVWGEPMVNMASVAVGTMTTSPLVLMRRSGEIVRVLTERPLEGTMAIAQVGGRVHVFVQPLADQAHLTAFAPDGSAVLLVEAVAPEAGRGVLRTLKVAAAGDTLYSRRFTYTPVRITAAARDSIHRVWAERFAGADPPAAALAAAKAHVRIPALLPPIEKVLLGADGRAWLGRQSLSPGTGTWVVLDRTGRRAAVVAAPPGVDLLHAGADHAWGLVTDSLHVPYVVRYRLVAR